MNYELLAEQLLKAKANMLQVPASQKLTKLLKGELFVLYYLKSNRGIIHPKELSEKLQVSTARISNILNHMEKNQLIVRIPDPNDSRQIIIHLTQTGCESIEKIRQDVLQSIAKTLEFLGPEDAKEYIRIQQRIYESCLVR